MGLRVSAASIESIHRAGRPIGLAPTDSICTRSNSIQSHTNPTLCHYAHMPQQTKSATGGLTCAVSSAASTKRASGLRAAAAPSAAQPWPPTSLEIKSILRLGLASGLAAGPCVCLLVRGWCYVHLLLSRRHRLDTNRNPRAPAPNSEPGPCMNQSIEIDRGSTTPRLWSSVQFQLGCDTGDTGPKAYEYLAGRVATIALFARRAAKREATNPFGHGLEMR